MNQTRARLTLLAFAVSATAAVAAQTNAPAADREQPGAVSIASPIVRNQGTTVIMPDRPMLGQLGRGAPTESSPFNEQPPPVLPAPNQEAKPNEPSTPNRGASETTR